MTDWYQQLKNVYHFWQAHWWRLYYGRPDTGMKIYGVTGTNGKTTTCLLLANILAEAAGREKVGMLTTVAFWVGEKEEVNKTKLTTLPSRLVFKYLQQMNQAGVKSVVLEMTSHALDQNRLAGIKLDGGIILNIEREHLDYHKTMKEYAVAKGRIVNYLKPSAPLVAKWDDKLVREAVEKRLAGSGARLIKFTADQVRQVTTPLPGNWNKENVLAASLLAKAIGIDEQRIDQGVASLRQVPGRMEYVADNVLIDYAVTPAALERLYKYVRSQTNGKIFGVLGAAGLRDRGKRPDMAQAVAEYADELVLTREDPWTESEEQIFLDLERGLDKKCEIGPAFAKASAGTQQSKGAARCEVVWQRITDRREAIKYCLDKAGSGDVVVVTGKGAEAGMALADKIIPWNDKQVILELLSSNS